MFEQAAEQNNMDPTIAKKKPKKKKAPAPPNPFTGEVESDNKSEVTLELAVAEEDEVSRTYNKERYNYGNMCLYFIFTKLHKFTKIKTYIKYYWP